ncbi:hypothetical protein HBI70_165570 [Parastagonospora nodorum]|nr:hypothetical protein HBI70_165570 [Parastagonospora nodorum]
MLVYTSRPKPTVDAGGVSNAPANEGLAPDYVVSLDADEALLWSNESTLAAAKVESALLLQIVARKLTLIADGLVLSFFACKASAAAFARLDNVCN